MGPFAFLIQQALEILPGGDCEYVRGPKQNSGPNRIGSSAHFFLAASLQYNTVYPSYRYVVELISRLVQALINLSMVQGLVSFFCQINVNDSISEKKSRKAFQEIMNIIREFWPFSNFRIIALKSELFHHKV